MTIGKLSVFVLGAVLASGFAVAATAAGPRDGLKGRYAFANLINPDKQKCVTVSGKLLADLQSKAFSCDPEASNSSTGHPFVSCKRDKPERLYMIFKTRAFCEDERKQQAANE
jgi:hypothetical protein